MGTLSFRESLFFYTSGTVHGMNEPHDIAECLVTGPHLTAANLFRTVYQPLLPHSAAFTLLKTHPLDLLSRFIRLEMLPMHAAVLQRRSCISGMLMTRPSASALRNRACFAHGSARVGRSLDGEVAQLTALVDTSA